MKTKRTWISVTAGVLAVVMAASLLVGGLSQDASGAPSSSELKVQLEELQAQKDVICDKIAALEQQQSENLEDIQSILDQKEVIDQQVALLYAQVANVNEQIAAYSLLIADKQKELDQAQARLEELNEQNKERIRAMEEEGDLSYWSVIFLASDLSDLLDRVNMIQEIAAADQRRLEEMSKVAQQVEQAKEELVTEKAALEQTRAQLEVTQLELDGKNAEADELLAQLLAVSDDLDGLHDQFEKEEEAFLDQLAQKEQEYNDQLAYEESSRQASIQASIEASIQESIEESIQESIRQEEATKQTSAPSVGDGDTGSNVDTDGIRWLTPCWYSHVSSPFGYRWHPVTGEWAMHKGVDLPAPKGTPIYASRSGFVTTATYHDTAGNYVTVNHQDGYSSVYMHMTHYVVEEGEYVKAGQLLGYVGSTGRSKGNHLHFGISYNGVYVNPMDHIG